MSLWSLEAFRQVRAKHLRHARRAAQFARESTGEVRRIWVAHCRQHIAAARTAQSQLIERAQLISASMFLRKTVGAHQRASRRVVGGARIAA